MKKYTKPVLFYENFELMQHIAGLTCSVMMNSDTEATCTTGDGSDSGGFSNMFVSADCGVNLDTLGEEYCYYNGDAQWVAFNS